MEVINMKCILCHKQQQPLNIRGIVTITCYSKTQILRSTVRKSVREMLEHDQDVVLVDTKESDSIFVDLD